MDVLSTLTRSLAGSLAARARTWSVDSQQGARRNALIANTALAARRRDRLDVEDWFAQPGEDGSGDEDRRAATS